jgi:thymidine phosphorylase
MTGTVESHELILASVGSKHLALPADHLLMDVRYGDGAFLGDRQEAERLATELGAVMEGGRVPTSHVLIDTPQPNGSAVGNAMEVLEAIAVMRGDQAGIWDARALSEQRALVISLFELLMSRSFGRAVETDWRALGERMLGSGEVFRWFLRMLEAHGVDEETRRAVESDPARVIGPQVEPIPLRARRDGVLRRIDQRRLGNLINFRMGGGGNEIAGSFEPQSGILLAKRLGDAVSAGDVLCTVRSPLWNDQLHDELIEYFEIT